MTPGLAKSMSVDKEDVYRMEMENDLSLGLCFKNELIPLALEYFLAVTKDSVQSEGISTQNDSNNFNRLDSTEVIRYDDARERPQTPNPRKLAEQKKNTIM